MKKDPKCFQYPVTIALNHKQIGKHSERITKNKPFSFFFERKKFSIKKDDWKNFQKNNVTIAFNVLYAEKEKIYSAYISKNNSNCEKQVIILMITNGEGQHYLAVRKL